MKKILGLDIGTNSIGWAMIETDPENNEGKILGAGVRIIPMQGMEKDFERGKSVSPAADRRMARMARRNKHRYKLRRTRLIRVLKILGWMPENFPENFKQYSLGDTPFDINYFIPFEQNTIDELKRVYGQENPPMDWAVYYLRDKGLREKLTLRELIRVIYHFNQRRGFKSSKKDLFTDDKDDINEVKSDSKRRITETVVVKIEGIVPEPENEKKNKFKITARTADERIITGTITLKTQPDWQGTERTFDITTETLKSGNKKVTFAIPEPNAWKNKKAAIEKELKDSGLFPGQYHFHKILADRTYRVKDRIIERDFYKSEFNAIWNNQVELIAEYDNEANLKKIAAMLYKYNLAKRTEIEKNSLLHLLMNDIIYYQRPLKSQKHLVGQCRYEKKNVQLGDGSIPGIKCVPRSAPEFQEFRIWQHISTIKIYRKREEVAGSKWIFNRDVTDEVITDEAKAELFKLFDTLHEVGLPQILKVLFPNANNSTEEYEWNYPADKKFKGNELKSFLRKAFRKARYMPEGEDLMNDQESIYKLWHILYSLDDFTDTKRAIINNFRLPENTAAELAEIVIPQQLRSYASYSSRAIKKLLSVMRSGSCYSIENLSPEVRSSIEHYLETGKVKGNNPAAKEALDGAGLKSLGDFRGLPPHLACYAVYGFHSERIGAYTYSSWEEIKTLPRNELRNPIVEKVVNETLLVTRDIWKKFGRPDSINIEMARELKKNAKERELLQKQNEENERNKNRIRAILRELKGANPDSPADVEKMRIWEESLSNVERGAAPKLSKEPTSAEIQQYILWGEQKHLSPYTGKVIPLSRLFTPEYQVEHILPKARYFDDSLGNKVICEAAVNAFKDKQTAMEMIYESGGREIEYKGTKFTLLNAEAYQQHINDLFHGKKKKHLLMEDIPEGFIERQLNDTRYITKKLGELLFPISGNILFTGGQVTAYLRQEWGLGVVWKELLLPRFKRLENMTGKKLIETDKETREIKFLTDYKRVDHRHHALDAITVAATSRGHIQYLNTLNAFQGDKLNTYAYRYLLASGRKRFILPWPSFTKDTLDVCRKIIVSFKVNKKLVTRGFNLYSKWIEKNGKMVLEKKNKQDNSNLHSVRVSMFKEPYGAAQVRVTREVKPERAIEIQLKYINNGRRKTDEKILDKELRVIAEALLKNNFFDIKAAKKHIKSNPLTDANGKLIQSVKIVGFESIATKRVPLDSNVDIKQIEAIPHADHLPIARILKDHLSDFGNDSKAAFSEEGLSIIWKKYNLNIRHITKKEVIGNKILLDRKYLETDKGGNLFYELLIDRETGVRNGFTIPLLTAVEKNKNGLPLTSQSNDHLSILFSPNELVLIGEAASPDNLSQRVYRVVRFSGSRFYCVPHFASTPIIAKEFDHGNCSEKAWDYEGDKPWLNNNIIDYCIKIKVDRLGLIIKE